MNELEQKLAQIEDFHFVHQNLFCSGQPCFEQFNLIKEYGVTTVLNLSTLKSLNQDQYCLDLGLNYIQIPFSKQLPTCDQAILALDLIHYLSQNQIVWLFSEKNQIAACLIYLYRQYYLNIDLPTAQEQLHAIWQPDETWTGFIHAVALQLQGRQATAEIQQTLLSNDEQ